MNSKLQKTFIRKYWWAIILVIGFLGIIAFFVLKDNLVDRDSVKNGNLGSNQTSEETQTNIKSLGINFDYYNPATNKAGDFVFTKIDLPHSRLFLDYGFVIPAEQTADGVAVINPHPTFILPLGTKVRALINGIVIDVPSLYSGDYSVQMTPDGKSNGLIFEVEHVKNPAVKKGDRVAAGQVVAEVTDFGSQYYPGYGSYDLAVFHAGPAGQPEHLCPFLYLDSSVKAEIEEKLLDFYKSWEEYVGNQGLYDTEYSVPGCLTIEPIAG